MADKIQLTLENMLPELEILVQEGIFKKSEVKKIIKKRRFYEYQFERKDITKLEYFKAIRYEKILDKRRLQTKKQLKMTKVNYYDYHFLRRIVYLFKKCLVKFRKDDSIWMEFFSFLLKHKCHNILNKEIGNCLVNHPYNLDFWRIAAYNEFENNSNSLACRTVLQKCLRINNNEIDAHLEYFIFELKFVEKIVERRQILTGENNQKEKLEFIGQPEMIVKDDENKVNANSPPQDDIILLRIPEVIWLKASSTLMNYSIKNKLNYSPIDTNLKFLSALMKYGSKLSYKRLKELIITSIIELNAKAEKKLTNIHLNIEITKAKLEKYNSDNKLFFQKCIKKFIKIIENEENKVDVHEIIYNMLLTLEKKFIDINESDREQLSELIIKTFSKYISKKDLIENCCSQSSLHIILFLYDNSLYTGNKYKTYVDLDSIIQEIIHKISLMKNYFYLGEYINIYWKYAMYNLGKSTDDTFTFFLEMVLSEKRYNPSVEFYKIVFSKMALLLQEEIKILPDKTSSFFSTLIATVKKLKLRDYDLLKTVYSSLIEILYNIILNKVPRETINFSCSKFLKTIEKEYLDSFQFLKTHMQQCLINYDFIKRELLEKIKKRGLLENEADVLKALN